MGDKFGGETLEDEGDRDLVAGTAGGERNHGGKLGNSSTDTLETTLRR